MTLHWLHSCTAHLPADLSGDCKVNLSDFAILASDWLRPAVQHEWAARYNGPDNDYDAAYAIVVDSHDNIYVTGDSWSPATDYDYTTIKYSPDSNQPVWVARYNGPDNDYDAAYAIVVDSHDNIYVTGDSWSPATDYDYATIKYSPDSNEPVWVARYNGPDDDYDAAYAIAVDSDDNIYVAGASFASATYDDFTTIKYSPGSNQPVWVARYNGPDNDYDAAYAIAVDSHDNIYVTGDSWSYATEYDYVTIKYSPDSNEPVWVARYNGPANNNDSVWDIAVDASDNIYVTGNARVSGAYNDYATIKYSPDSNQPVWVARCNGPASDSNDHALAMAVDSNNNIYITGYTHASGMQHDYLTVKYSPDSNEPVWVARYNGPANQGDKAFAIAVDSNDNIYVTGESESSGTYYDYATIKYSPDSNEPVWVARYNGAGNDPDTATALTVDSNDSIYVTGYSTGSGTGYDYATIRYSPDHTCTPQITGDFDHDCDVDIYDLEIFCQSWLECNLDPPHDCWQ
jgi:uncharacterized delta-60 repeat protein